MIPSLRIPGSSTRCDLTSVCRSCACKTPADGVTRFSLPRAINRSSLVLSSMHISRARQARQFTSGTATVAQHGTSADIFGGENGEILLNSHADTTTGGAAGGGDDRMKLRTKILDNMRKRGEYEEVLAKYQEWSSADVPLNEYIYSCVLLTLKEMKNVPMMEKVFNDLLRFNLKPNIVIYNNMLAGTLSKERLLYYYGDMKKRGVNPDHVTFNTVLDQLRAYGDIETSAEVFAEMELYRVNPSKKTFMIMLSTFSDIKTIGTLLDRMRASSLPHQWPTLYTYSFLITRFGRKGDLDSVQYFVDRMQQEKIKPDAVFHNLMINTYLMWDRVPQALSYYETMRQSNAVTSKTFELLICKLADMGEKYLDIVLHLCEDMRVICGEIQPDKKIGQTLSRVLPNDHPLLAQLGLSGNEQTIRHNALMITLATNKDSAGAVQLIEQMKAQGIPRSVKTYLTLLHVLHSRNETKKLLHYFDCMKEEGLEPTEIAYNIVLDGLVKIAALDRAVQLFEEMKRKPGFNLIVGYNTLMKYYTKKQNIHKVQELFAEMQERNIRPDDITYNLLKMWSWQS